MDHCLPTTGSEVWPLALIAVGAIVVGALLWWAGRRGLGMTAVVVMALALTAVASAPAFAAADDCPDDTTTPFPITVTPPSIDFGDVYLGATSPEQIVTVTNTSGETQAVTIGGGAAGAFGGTTSCGGVSSLAPGASCAFFYEFSPTDLGAAAGSTIIQATAGSITRDLTVDFTGNGLFPFSLAPTSIDFGGVAYTHTSPSHPVTVTNISGVTQNPVAITGGDAGVFSATTNCDSTTSFAAGDTCVFDYTFSPDGVHPFTGDAIIGITAAGATRSYTMNFTGTGLPAE